MEMNYYHLTLAILLLVGGSASTLFTKWADEQTSPGVDGVDRPFRHPFMQAWAMTFGEMMCLVVYAIQFYCKKDGDDDVSETKTNSDNAVDMTIDMAVDQNKTTKPNCVESQEVQEKNKKKNFYTFSPLLFLPTALCHMTGRVLFFISVTLTDVVSVQMLRGAIIIFTSLLTRIFLRKKLPLYKWAAVLVTTAGIVVVGLADVFPNPLDKNNDDNGQTNTSLAGYKSSMFSLGSFGLPSSKLANSSDTTGDGEGTEPTVDPDTMWIGDILIIAAVALLAAQMVYEEKFVKKYKCAPLQVMGTEGTFGFIILSILLVPMYWIPIGDSELGNSPRPVLEDSKDGFIQLGSNPWLLVAFIGTVVSISFTNFAGISMTKAMTATHRVVLDQGRTIIIWVVSLAAKWSEFNPIHLLGFFMLLLGICLFNNILFRPMYQKYRKKSGKGSWTLEHEVAKPTTTGA